MSLVRIIPPESAAKVEAQVNYEINTALLTKADLKRIAYSYRPCIHCWNAFRWASLKKLNRRPPLFCSRKCKEMENNPEKFKREIAATIKVREARMKEYQRCNPNNPEWFLT